jgi:hypothetical protein
MNNAKALDLMYVIACIYIVINLRGDFFNNRSKSFKLGIHIRPTEYFLLQKAFIFICTLQ